MKSIIILIALTLLPLYSQPKSFIREYTYVAGEADSKITSRAIAIEQVKRILLEEIGVYLHSEMVTIKEEDSNGFREVTKQQILSITAGITQTKILDEKWDGKSFYIKTEIIVDAEDVSIKINDVLNNKRLLNELVLLQSKADAALVELEHLKKELLKEKIQNTKNKIQAQYNKQSDILVYTNLVQQGYYLRNTKEYFNSIETFKKAIELFPDSAQAYVGIAFTYNESGQTNYAIETFNHVVAIDSRYSALSIGMAVIYLQKQEYKNTISLLSNLLSLNLTDVDTYFLIGDAYSGLNDYDKALEMYQKALTYDPKHSGVYASMGALYLNKGLTYEAISSYKKAIELNPNDVYSYCNLGIVYYKNGEKYEAINCFQKAIKINPNLLEAYLRLGQIYMYGVNDFSGAIKCFKKIIEISPNMADAYFNASFCYNKLGDQEMTIYYLKGAARNGHAKAQETLTKLGRSWN